MISPLIALPLAAATMLFLAAHVIALGRSEQPLSRQRIRQANGLLGMLTVGLMSAGMCVFDPSRSPREWALSWIAVMMLVTLHVLLAMADAINSARLRRRAIRQFREASRRLREDVAYFGVRLDGDAARGRTD
jgi:hypothetical protein